MLIKTLKHWFLHKPDPERAVAAVPAELWAEVEAQLPFLDYLPAAERPRLRALAVDFLAEKEFYGARGFCLTDHILLTIALQACLPILKRGLAAYRGWVGVVVYSGEFVAPRSDMDEDGVVHEYDDVLSGEAWPDGPVLLSWFDKVERGKAVPAGMNAVIHEFAHKLDMAGGGDANGLPPLPAHMSARQWKTVFTAAYDELRAQVDADEETAIDPYAAEDPAEFFAVATEAFFETPHALKAAFPAVYEQLVLFYEMELDE
ncbi:MAG: zinc-dependent peptidase [Zoogloeaceae bacterium]|jgi:Mlc titration factor MtfA (ptsG expression regulator)|nr:zinc-dependent peptidase [Zoogloeaceae bacterium]